jgi:hypothetical protein
LHAFAVRVGDQRSRECEQIAVRGLDLVEVAVGPDERQQLLEIRLCDA